MAKQDISPWNRRIQKLPSWVSLREVSIQAGFHPDYLSQVKQGRVYLNRTQARKVISVLSSLEPVIKYKQQELF